MGDKKASLGGMAANMKKAVTEMVLLSFLEVRPMHIFEMLQYMDEKSGSACKIAYPYATIYRLLDSNYIQEAGKRTSDNDRRRQYYSITESGRAYLTDTVAQYKRVTGGVELIFNFVKSEKGED